MNVMKKISIIVLFVISGLTQGYSQTISQLFSETKKTSYIVGYSSIQFDNYNYGNFMKYNNSTAVTLGIDYRFFERKNHQFTAGALLNYSTLEYRLNNNFTDTGAEIFLEVPVKFEYNIALTEKLYVTPSAGLNFSAYLNSEQRYFQNYFYEGGNYETMIQTKPFTLGGTANVALNYKTSKGVFGINAGYSTSLNDVYRVNHTNIDNNSFYSQDLKRKFVTFGLKFTPKK